MSKAYDFLKECGAFFVLTVNGDCPAGRPFGAVHHAHGRWYRTRGCRCRNSQDRIGEGCQGDRGDPERLSHLIAGGR